MSVIQIIFTCFIHIKDFLIVNNLLIKSVYHEPYTGQFYHLLTAQTSSMVKSNHAELEQKPLEIRQNL
jgi:hypothetical protein